MTVSSDPRWRGLLAIGAAAALLTAACIPLQVILYLVVPPPTSHAVTAWFDLFAAAPVTGLLSLDLLMMVEQVLIVPIALGLWLLTHRASESAALVGVAAWLFGAVLIVASNTGFEMLSLARGFAQAGELERSAYLAAGQAMLASYWDMGTSFVFGYVLASVGGLLAGVALLRSGVAGRAAGWLLVVGNVVGLGIFVPGAGVALSLLSVAILWAWFARIGWWLLRCVRAARPSPAVRIVPIVA
jgi:hypothetical protein